MRLGQITDACGQSFSEYRRVRQTAVIIQLLLLLPKNCPFLLLLSHSAPPLRMFPLEFRSEVTHEEIRVMRLVVVKVA